MSKSLRILHLEDDFEYSCLVRSLLEAEGFEVDMLLVAGRRDFEAALERETFDIILADFLLPDYTGLDALGTVRERFPHTPFLLVSGTIAEATAIDSLKSGATDYVLKVYPERLVPAIRRALAEAEERTRRLDVESELARQEGYFRTVTENILDILLILDAQARVLYHSPSVKCVLGLDPEVIVGDDALQYVHPEDVPKVREALARQLEEIDRVTTLEFRVRHADGSYRTMEAIARNRLNVPEAKEVVVSARDITDRKAAEAQLRESEHQYRLIFDENPIPMWVFDHETLAFLEVNDAAVKSYGYSRDEFLAMRLKDIRVSDDMPALLEYLHRLTPVAGCRCGVCPGAPAVAASPSGGSQPAGGPAQAGNKMGFAGVWQHRKKDGSIIDVELKWSPIVFRGRAASLTMAIDVTERKRVEHRDAAFAKLGQKLSSSTSPADAARIIGEVADDLFQWDSLTLDLCSAEGDRITSLLTVDTDREGRRFEVEASELPTRASPLAREVVEKGARLILRDDPSIPDDSVFRIGDKTRASASLMFAPIRNRTRVIGILSVQSYSPKAYTVSDLGLLQTLADHCGGALERIHAEQALKENELLFHSVWENSLDGMRLTDGEGRIVAVNSAFCRMVGMDRAALEGKPYTCIYSAEEAPEQMLAAHRDKFLERRIESAMERRLVLHNGVAITLEERASLVELPGREPLLFSVLRDITAQKRLEDQFRHAQKMEAIGQLAGGVAHDFNNILTVIHGHGSLLTSAGDLPDRAARSAEQIVQAAERAAGLTRQLLTFSRRQVLQTRRLDLNEVVGNLTKMLGRILGEDIALQLNYSPRPAYVEADAGMIEQVLMNLAVNSRDAMPQGGVLNIRVAHRQVGIEESHSDPEAVIGKFVCLSVTDSGCGIPRENMRRIFEPFFTTKEVGKGTGLGLATVYGIVKQHQGWVKVESEVGKGTTFRVFLPQAAQASAASSDTAPAPAVRGGEETILVVEDEEPVRELVCHLLSGHGYQILQAESGPKALDVWRERKDDIDLLLTDLVMPDRMNGRELAERLWADRPDLKVVFTSGYSAEVVGRDFTGRGGLQYLQKPYHPTKLASVVRDCLDA